MNLNEEHFREIEEMASLFLSPEEIAINLEVDIDEFLMEIQLSGVVAQYYHRGRLKTSIELRKAILQAAVNGSSPAQQMMKEFYSNTQL